MVSKKPIPKYQVQCEQCECDVWFTEDKHIVCPHCGAKLNEFSSEDENDGRIENPS
jgi:uncharacterized Zn ribbon protein